MVGLHLSRQHTTGEREAHDDADVSFDGGGEEIGDLILAEDVEDRLDRGELWMRQREVRLFHRLDAGAEILDEAVVLEVFEPRK